MDIKFFSIFLMCFFSTFSFGQVEKECDPENTVGFIKICGEVPKEMKPGVQKRPLWQGTNYPGYQLIDCQKRTIKNVIESTGESYSCQVKGEDYFPVRADKKLDEIDIVNSKEEKSPLIKVIPDSKSYDPNTFDRPTNSNPSKSSRASAQ